MIGVDTFSSVFGGAPDHTRSHLPEHVRAIIRAGYSPVLCAPLTADPLCTLSPTVARRTGAHPCGSAHVLDDPAKSGAIVKRLLDQHGTLNIALHLGRSQLAVYLTEAGPGMTVQGPGRFGYWWFTLPEQVSSGALAATGWVWPQQGPVVACLVAGNQYVLVPPARMREEQQFRLVGGTMAAPEWML